jgi:serine/threonine-protein kinase
MSVPDEPAHLDRAAAVAALARGDHAAALEAVDGSVRPADLRVAGHALLALGDRAAARRAFEQALAGATDGLDIAGDDPAGPPTPDAAGAALAHEGLAAVARATGELGEAAAQLAAALRCAPSDALHGLHRQAAALAQRRDDLPAAERHAAHALATAADPAGREAAADRVLLGSILTELGRHADAIEELRLAVDLLTGLHGAAHVDVASARTELAAALEAGGLLDEAVAQHEAVLEQRATAIGADHPSHALRLLALSALDRDRGRIEGARAWAQRAITVLDGQVPANDPLLRRAQALAAL